MDSADAWKRYYAAERASIGRDGLLRLLDETPSVPLDPTGATVIPHTRLVCTGNQIAATVNAIVTSGAARVLALGVLHGARRADAASVSAARAGDPVATAALRGVHDETGLAAEEFSLDAFAELLALAAARAQCDIEIVRRYPYLVGTDPATLPGLDELAALADAGAIVVATTDPMHHGHAYGTAPPACLPADDAATVASTRAAIEEQLEALRDHRFDDFQAVATRDRSDFRDTGPVLATLLGRGFATTIHDLALVDYSAALAAPAPSWVAGALVSATRAVRSAATSACAAEQDEPRARVVDAGPLADRPGHRGMRGRRAVSTAEIVIGEWSLTAAAWTDRHDHEETNWVLEGELHVTTAGHRDVVVAGQAVVVPPGVRARYEAPRHARMLFVYGPSTTGHGARDTAYEDLSTAAGGGVMPAASA